MEQTTRKNIESGFAPIRKLNRTYILLGGLMIVASLPNAALLGGNALAIASTIAGIGVFLVAGGVVGIRLGSTAQVLSSSLNLVEAGRLNEAGALLDPLEKITSPGIATARGLQRAMIALRRGDLDEAERQARQVISAPPSLLFREEVELRRGVGLGLRAFARAAKGDIEGATSDSRAARASPVSVEALAHASLAEAMVLERCGDRAGLAAILRRDRRLLLGGLGMRERAVVRAMQRLLKVSPTSVYRTPAAPQRLSMEDEPTIVEWLDRVAPQLSAFALQPGAPTSLEQSSPPELVPTAEGIGKAKAKMPKRAFPMLSAGLVLWGVIIPLLGILPFLALRGSGLRFRLPPLREPANPLSMLYGAFVMALCLGMYVWQIRRQQSQLRRRSQLRTAMTAFEPVDGELSEMAASKQALTAAQAELFRALLADRRGALEQGIAHIDAARARLTSDASRAAAAGLLSPHLTAARAHLLAAMGRVDEAAAELSLIPPDYLYFDRTRFTVRLVALLAQGDVDGAGRLVEATPLELSIGPRDELLRDLVRAAAAPGRVGPAEIARLREELREDDESRAWIERVAPALLVRFNQATGEGDEGDETGAETGLRKPDRVEWLS